MPLAPLMATGDVGDPTTMRTAWAAAVGPLCADGPVVVRVGRGGGLQMGLIHRGWHQWLQRRQGQQRGVRGAGRGALFRRVAVGIPDGGFLRGPAAPSNLSRAWEMVLNNTRRTRRRVY